MAVPRCEHGRICRRPLPKRVALVRKEIAAVPNENATDVAAVAASRMCGAANAAAAAVVVRRAQSVCGARNACSLLPGRLAGFILHFKMPDADGFSPLSVYVMK